MQVEEGARGLSKRLGSQGLRQEVSIGRDHRLLAIIAVDTGIMLEIAGGRREEHQVEETEGMARGMDEDSPSSSSGIEVEADFRGSSHLRGDHSSRSSFRSHNTPSRDSSSNSTSSVSSRCSHSSKGVRHHRLRGRIGRHMLFGEQSRGPGRGLRVYSRQQARGDFMLFCRGITGQMEQLLKVSSM